MNKAIYRPRKVHYYAYGGDMKAYVKIYYSQRWVVEKWNYNAQKVLISLKDRKSISIEISMKDFKEYFAEVKECTDETESGN